jgi:hypothetical protein
MIDVSPLRRSPLVALHHLAREHGLGKELDSAEPQLARRAVAGADEPYVTTETANPWRRYTPVPLI